MAYQKVSPCHCDESHYKLSCPICGAPPGFQCAARNSGQPQRRPHRKRAPADRKPSLPDLRLWWRKMSIYEGEHGKKRPSWLVIP